MKIKRQPLLSIITAAITIYAAIIGYHYSYYRLALLGILVLFGIGIILFGLLFVFLRYWAKKPKAKAMLVSLNSVEVLFAAIMFFYVAEHYISSYKPTRTFYIPNDYVGCIYLFETTEALHSDTISENGIGYIHWNPDYFWRLERNGVDVTQAWHVGNSRGSIQFFHEDSTIMETIEVGCALINDSNHYEEFSVYSTIIPVAMHPATYTEMVKWGWIDDDRVVRWKQKRIDKLSKWSYVLGKYVGDKPVEED